MLKPLRSIAVLLTCAAIFLVQGSTLGGASSFPLAASAPPLGTAKTFAVLGGSGVSNSGDSTVIGDLGVSPGAAITGFPPGTVTGATYTGADAAAVQAQDDVTAAYDDLAGQSCDTTYPAGSKDLAGETLLPGVYCADEFALSGTLTLGGGATDVWVFRSTATLVTSTDAAVVLSGGGKSCNVWWQVGSSATLGTGTAFAGNILAFESITVNANAQMFGAALARTGAVTLDTNNISGCFGPNAIAIRELRAIPATELYIGLEIGAGVALLLALGPIFIRRRVTSSPGTPPPAPHEKGE